MRRQTFFVLGTLALIGATLTLSARAQGPTVTVGMTDSLFPGLSGERLQKASGPFRSLLGSVTGMKGQVVTARDGDELATKLKKDEVQLGVFQGIEFAWAKKANPKLEPIVLCVNQSETLRAFLLVRANSTLKKPADLRGKKLTAPEELRTHCKVFLWQDCLPDSVKASKFFGKVNRTSDTETAIDDVVDGLADAALVDGLAWESYRTAKPGAARRLRVLVESKSFPCTVLACQSGKFTAAQLKQVRQRLLSPPTLRARGLMQQMRLTEFKEAGDDYAQLVTAALKAYPPPK